MKRDNDKGRKGREEGTVNFEWRRVRVKERTQRREEREVIRSGCVFLVGVLRCHFLLDMNLDSESSKG